jgi:hypothetical protein
MYVGYVSSNIQKYVSNIKQTAEQAAALFKIKIAWCKKQNANR